MNAKHTEKDYFNYMEFIRPRIKSINFHKDELFKSQKELSDIEKELV